MNGEEPRQTQEAWMIETNWLKNDLSLSCALLQIVRIRIIMRLMRVLGYTRA